MSNLVVDDRVTPVVRGADAPVPARSLLSSLTAQLRRVPALRRLKRAITDPMRLLEGMTFRSSDVAQKNLVATWKGLQASGVILPLDQVGFSRFSEFEEDGQLLYVMTLAGAQSRTVVEISSQDGRTCMATNLVVHHRWRGFLFDGDPVFVADGQEFFANHVATRSAPPVMRAEWFTRDNINQVLASAGVPAEVDVLSLDIDGNDLYLWDAMNVRPRVLICEFNNAVPSELALTIPYKDDFSFKSLPAEQELFRSASLGAYVAVCRRKGYRLVGMNALGFNAIFLRDDVLTTEMPEIATAVLDDNPFAQQMRATWWPTLSRLPWVEVKADGRF